jgi:hypothetical protein
MPFSRAHGVVMLACQQNPKTDCRAAVIGMSQYLDLCRLEKSYSKSGRQSQLSEPLAPGKVEPLEQTETLQLRRNSSEKGKFA